MGNRFKYRKWQVSSQILPLMVPVPYSRQDSCSVSPPIMPMSVPRARSLQMFNKFPSKSWWKWQMLHHQPCYFIIFSPSSSFNSRPWMLEQKGQNISYLPFLPKKKEISFKTTGNYNNNEKLKITQLRPRQMKARQAHSPPCIESILSFWPTETLSVVKWLFLRTGFGNK